MCIFQLGISQQFVKKRIKVTFMKYQVIPFFFSSLFETPRFDHVLRKAKQPNMLFGD